MDEGAPAIADGKAEMCYGCQHCMAVCPQGALSVSGHDPARSLPLAGYLPTSEQMETLIKGRRSVRRYREENLEPELIQRLLETAWHAPSGVNARKVRFTVIDDRKKLAALREGVMTALGELHRAGALKGNMEFFARFVSLWEDKRVDVIFRGAPHLVVASAPKQSPTPVPDCFIALSYLELFAQSLGVGTLWCGLAKWALEDLVPEAAKPLGIPDDHVLGYVMLFGKPAVKYARTVQHGPADIVRPM